MEYRYCCVGGGHHFISKQCWRAGHIDFHQYLRSTFGPQIAVWEATLLRAARLYGGFIFPNEVDSLFAAYRKKHPYSLSSTVFKGADFNARFGLVVSPSSGWGMPMFDNGIYPGTFPQERSRPSKNRDERFLRLASAYLATYLRIRK